MIHMTSTGVTDGKFTVTCRCPWQETGFDTRAEARQAGDAHLAAANAPVESAECKHCGRHIVNDPTDGWVDPEASGDDVIWRETCDENHEDRIAAHEPKRAVTVTVTRSAGDDRAVLILIDTTFEPNGSDGGPGLRVLINDDEAYVGKAYDFGSDHEAQAQEFSVSLADIPYTEED